MKLTLVFVLALLAPLQSLAQQSLASTMKVYVFPTGDQDSAQQQKDEASCFDWANQNTGTDPFELAKEAQQQEELAVAQTQAAQTTGAGSGLSGAARGAAVGAVIGEIADDDAGKGAAWGAALGGVRGRRKGGAAQYEAEQQVAQNAQAAEQSYAEQVENFKKAFGVCLEAKDYLVKY